jgi:hypothetical protein
LVVASVIGLLLIVGPLVGFLLTFVLPEDDWFAKVNGEPISRATLLDLLRANQIDASIANQPFDVSRELFTMTNRLTDNEVLRQNARDQGFEVSDADIEAELFRQLAPNLRGPLDEPTTQAQFDERLRQYLGLRRLSQGQLYAFVEGEMLRKRVMDIVRDELEDPQPQLHLHSLTVPDLATAEQARLAAQAGTSFEHLAQRYGVSRSALDLGWLPYDALPPGAADLLWNLAPFDLSPPYSSGQSDLVVLYVVSGREASRPLDDVSHEILVERGFEEAMDELRAEQDIELRVNSELAQWVSEELAKTRAPGPGA